MTHLHPELAQLIVETHLADLRRTADTHRLLVDAVSARRSERRAVRRHV